MRIFRLHRAQRGAGLRRVAALSGEMESGGDADVVRGVDAFAGMPGDASSFAAESDTDRFGLQLGGIEGDAGGGGFPGRRGGPGFDAVWAAVGDWSRGRGDSRAERDYSIEFNVLLNPTHSEYTEIEWSEPEPFRSDQRLIMKTTA